ncbi:VOC family protein [Lewinella sp. 4G2]|uniref:VOC family protein n=1 Tax=Lewinella sp. 4G2 TaxID=1803372 RepID=UPI0007B47F2B|nr:VOC family protein [Lewinella sp. 4G2]OAV42633.1 bleomycin resistance protein [Lewinella sp. 4G2]
MNLNQVTVPTRDVERSIGFYETLGLELIVKALPHYARFHCPDGNATFSLHQVEDLPAGEGIYVYFECEDLDNHVSRLMEKGIHFEHGPVDQRWNWREARLKDPDGNQLILFWGGEDRINPPWRIS